MLKPSRSLDPALLRENIVTREEHRPTRRPHADEAGPSDPPRQDAPHGVPLKIPYAADEDSHAYFDRMCPFYFIQEMCTHFGVSGHYLTHQVDTLAAAQRFQDCFA